ncbi:MAG: hypothetical protein Kow0060_21720 [Methylohalobius crimeensis]
MSNETTRLSLNGIQRLTGKDKRTIKARLADTGIKPAAKKGRAHLYDAPTALAAIYTHPGEAQHKTRLDLGDERAKLAKAQREKIELEMAIRQGKYLPAEAVVEIGSAMVGEFRSKILAVHHRVKQRWPHLDNAIIDEIKHLHSEALQELADGNLDESVLNQIGAVAEQYQERAR